jgi:hypothetical protein
MIPRYDGAMTTTQNTDMQVLTARRVADTPDGWPTWDVYSDELGLLGNYVTSGCADHLDREEAIALAMEDQA